MPSSTPTELTCGGCAISIGWLRVRQLVFASTVAVLVATDVCGSGEESDEARQAVITCAFLESADPKTSDQPTFQDEHEEWYAAADVRDFRVLCTEIESTEAADDSLRVTLDPRDATLFSGWVQRNPERTLGLLTGDRVIAQLPAARCRDDMLLVWSPGSSTAKPMAARSTRLSDAYVDASLASSWIELQRSRCSDDCSSYTIRVNGAGEIAYVGDAGVAQIGARRGATATDAVRRLFLRFQAADFLALNAAAAPLDESDPTTTMTLHIEGKQEHTLRFASSLRSGRPPTETDALLDVLARAVDVETRSQRWTGKADARPRLAIARGSEYQPKDWSAVEIRLTRSACRGTCPVYEVVIRGDGSVEYVGARHVAVTGAVTSSVSRDIVDGLIDRFQEAAFWELKSSYEMVVSDIASTAITLRMDGRTKKVINRWTDLPEATRQTPDMRIHRALDSISRAIDTSVDAEQWVRLRKEGSRK